MSVNSGQILPFELMELKTAKSIENSNDLACQIETKTGQKEQRPL